MGVKPHIYMWKYIYLYILYVYKGVRMSKGQFVGFLVFEGVFTLLFQASRCLITAMGSFPPARVPSGRWMPTVLVVAAEPKSAPPWITDAIC